MKKCNRQILSTLLSVGTAMSILAPGAFAQHEHGKGDQPAHKDDGHSHGEVKSAADYAAAVREIGQHMITLDGLISKGDLDAAHDHSDAIGALAKSLGTLALKTDSGVDRAQVKDINKAGKALAEASDGVHEASETKNLAAAKAAYAQMKTQFESLVAFTPGKYFCPMHCEEAKTYDKPGKCPVCSMNLKKQTSDKFTMDVKPLGGTISVGKPTTMVFTIKDPTGLPVKKVEVVHEKLLHLLMVSKDLSWYAHEHPEIQPDGTFTFTYTFPEAGEFFFYNDFTPPNVGQQVVTVPVTVAGTAPAAKALKVDAGTPKTIDGYIVSLDTGGPVKSGGSTHMAYTVTKDGKPVTTLLPYLGAMGHLVIISEDRSQFVHSHPHEGGEHGKGGHDAHGGHGVVGKQDNHAGHGAAPKAADVGKGMGGPKVDFEAHFKEPGTYKAWVQFNVGTAEKEQVLTVPFTFIVEKGEGEHEHKHGAAPANAVCPITADAADANIIRDFKGQAVAFNNAAAAAKWDTMSDTDKLSKFVTAIAASSAKAEHGDDAMPAGLDADEERALYLTPGGIYTEADIKANGSLTAGDKFKGKMAKHDMKPKAGEKICPITMTKANPKFTWIIGGKTYEFCCPPCIDEYVLLAKTSPKEILNPSEYVKK